MVIWLAELIADQYKAMQAYMRNWPEDHTFLVPEKLSNNGFCSAKTMEERELAKENSEQPPHPERKAGQVRCQGCSLYVKQLGEMPVKVHELAAPRDGRAIAREFLQSQTRRGQWCGWSIVARV